jgi:hypothetical protein
MGLTSPVSMRTGERCLACAVSGEEGVTDRIFGEIVRLIEQAEQAAAASPDPTSLLAHVIRLVVKTDADPYLILGVLVEGVAHSLATRIPDERRGEIGKEVSHLLAERFKAHGIQ